MTDIHDPFGARSTIDTPLGERTIYRLDSLTGIGDVDTLPYSIKVLLESALRNHDGRVVTDADVHAVARYVATQAGKRRSPISPPGSFSRTSRAFPPSSISPRCGPRSSE